MNNRQCSFIIVRVRKPAIIAFEAREERRGEKACKAQAGSTAAAGEYTDKKCREGKGLKIIKAAFSLVYTACLGFCLLARLKANRTNLKFTQNQTREE